MNKEKIDHNQPLKNNAERKNFQQESNGPELSKINVETSEGVEGLIGSEVSESTSEGSNKVNSGTIPAGATKAQIQDIKAHLLNNLPPTKVMVKEIRAILNIEMKEVVKQTKKAQKAGNYYLLNRLFAKLRSITEKLARIKDAGIDYVKNLWLKVVHGII
ncbi:hypothetical protein KKG71_00965 [Patescibacteria group bacterium]|nr:hypothetical protein [Patescibacteria group bacterium]